MRQRKERDSKFKLPWFLADTGGSGRLFLECLGDVSLQSVSITLDGQRVGFTPLLRPGSFVEIDWLRNSEVKEIADWGGWREAILTQELNRRVLATMKGIERNDTPVAEIRQALAEYSESVVAEVEKVMPKDLDRWKHTPHPFRLEVGYTSEGGKVAGTLKGTLKLDMERQWYLFEDAEGNATPLH
jgi:hypothetical protein